MALAEQIAALEAENEALREENARLQAHVCVTPAAPRCTCVQVWHGVCAPPGCALHGHAVQAPFWYLSRTDTHGAAGWAAAGITYTMVTS